MALEANRKRLQNCERRTQGAPVRGRVPIAGNLCFPSPELVSTRPARRVNYPYQYSSRSCPVHRACAVHYVSVVRSYSLKDGQQYTLLAIRHHLLYLSLPRGLVLVFEGLASL